MSKIHSDSCHRSRHKDLGLPELIAIALGGMIGGGIFSILGVSVAMIGVFTPLALLVVETSNRQAANFREVHSEPIRGLSISVT